MLYCSPVFMITMNNAADVVLFARLRIIIIFDWWFCARLVHLPRIHLFDVWLMIFKLLYRGACYRIDLGSSYMLFLMNLYWMRRLGSSFRYLAVRVSQFRWQRSCTGSDFHIESRTSCASWSTNKRSAWIGTRLLVQTMCSSSWRSWPCTSQVGFGRTAHGANYEQKDDWRQRVLTLWPCGMKQSSFASAERRLHPIIRLFQKTLEDGPVQTDHPKIIIQ